MNLSSIHSLFLECQNISIDTRKIKQNSLFFAIKGENFDANTFAKEAIQKGAAYAIIDNPTYHIEGKTILVKNSLTTLQQLATYHREFLKIPIIALTGSNGKTTTKELIYLVLSKKYKTKATFGNLNNHIGVPLTLLSFDEKTEIGIVEMGANHQKEIALLCELAKPDFGYITNFGKAHLEGFGGVEGVIKGKSEMYDYLSKNNKKAFINLEDLIQVEKSKMFSFYSFGINKKESNVNINYIKANPYVEVSYSDLIIKTQLIGLYNSSNVNAALTIGKYFNVENELIKEALESYSPENNRSQLINSGTNQIILDAYNANPSSMVVAIENFLQFDNKNKIIVLGDMFELGTESHSEHLAIINLLLKHENVHCYLVGKEFYSHKLENTNFDFSENYEIFSKKFKEKKFENSSILIKGSRGMALERTVEML